MAPVAADPPHSTLARGDGVALDVEDHDVAIFSHGPNAMSLFDTEGRIFDVNDRWVSLYGYTRQEARAMSVQDVSAEPEVTREAVRQSEGGFMAGDAAMRGQLSRARDQ